MVQEGKHAEQECFSQLCYPGPDVLLHVRDDRFERGKPVIVWFTARKKPAVSCQVLGEIPDEVRCQEEHP